MSGIPAWAVKGAKVVCVKVLKLHPLTHGGPKVNDVVTIARVHSEEEKLWEVGGEVYRSKAGLFFELVEWPGTGQCHIECFRPLVSNERTEEQDVALFLPLLKPVAPVKERA